MMKSYSIKYSQKGKKTLMIVTADAKPLVEKYDTGKTGDTYNVVCIDECAEVTEKQLKVLKKKLPGFKKPGLN